MLIVTAVNVTYNENGDRVLVMDDGVADYMVEVAVNSSPPIWHGGVHHVRDEGASALLRRIADEMDKKL